MNSLETYEGQFLDHLVAVRGRAKSTSQAYDYDLKHFLAYLKHLEITEPSQVTSKAIENYLQQLETSMVTKARRRSSIAAFFNFLNNQQILADNPCQRLESLKLPHREPAYVTPEQQARLLNLASKTTPHYRLRDRAIIGLLGMGGLRRSELLGLNVNDVDLESGSLKIIRKGNKEQYLPLHPCVIEVLADYLQSIKRTGNQPLFMSRLGNRLSGQALWHRIKLYAKRAGLSEQVTVHSLRHGFASTLLTQNLPLPYISQLMGHANIQTTSRYLHFQHQQVRDSFAKIEF